VVWRKKSFYFDEILIVSISILVLHCRRLVVSFRFPFVEPLSISRDTIDVLMEVAGIMCHDRVKQELWSWMSTIGSKVCFVEDSMSGGLDAAAAQVPVTNVKVGGCVT
jgi:hypothetical protein